MTILYVVLFGIVGLIVLASLLFYFIAISTRIKREIALDFQKDLVINNSKEDKENSVKRFAFFSKEYFCGDAYVKSADGLMLHAYTAEREDNKQWVIFAHGFERSGAASLDTEKIKMHLNRGFSALMVDLRGHGKSEGSYAGYGWQDRTDLIIWMGYLNEKYKASDIILDGLSFGAAAALLASCEKLPSSIRCILAEGSYTSLNGLFAYQLKKVFHLPVYPLLWTASIVCRIFAGYYFSEVQPIKAVAKSRIPILFINGSDDKLVPPEMARSLFDAAAGEKEILVVNGACHGACYQTNPVFYRRVVESFVDSHLCAAVLNK